MKKPKIKKVENVITNHKIVANHPVSRNLARLLNYYELDKKAWKKKINNIQEEIWDKYQKEVSAQSIEKWIKPRKNDLNRPQRVPYDLKKLGSLAKYLGIENPWDLFVPHEAWINTQNNEEFVNLKTLSSEQIRFIKIIALTPPAYFKGIDSFLKAHIGEDLKEKFPDNISHEDIERLNNLLNLIYSKSST